MAMLRSATRLAFRQSAPPSRFVGNVGRRNPASSITFKRNYYDFRKEDFTGWYLHHPSFLSNLRLV